MRRSYTGLFDPNVSDREVCSRVWTMMARLGGFGTTRWGDGDEEEDLDEDESAAD